MANSGPGAGHHAHDLFDDFYTRLAADKERPSLAYCGEKNPHLEHALDLIGTMYPTAMYVHAIRDPRDSACSSAAMNDTSVTRALDSMPGHLLPVETFVADLAREQYVQVRYEDLIADYAQGAAAVFEGLGIEMDEAALRYVQEFATVDSHSGVAARGSQAAKVAKHAIQRESTNFQETSLARWRRELTAAEQAHAATVLGPYLERYEYPLD